MKGKKVRRARRNAQGQAIGGAAESFPRWLWRERESNRLTIDAGAALLFSAESVRRIPNELLGALVRAAMYASDGAQIEHAQVLGSDGDALLLAALRRLMGEQPEHAMRALRGVA